MALVPYPVPSELPYSPPVDVMVPPAMPISPPGALAPPPMPAFPE